MIGSTLSHYRILRKIGSGGMGEVYLAEDSRLERNVAIKILPPELADDSGRRSRFEAEAKAASAINHPNITHIYDVGEAGGVHFIAMEYVEGGDLGSRLASTPLEVREIVNIGAQTADALADAHERGIVHRDIKPGNIMVDPRGRVKVLDFGLAKLRTTLGSPHDDDALTETMTQPGVVMGTVRYMSPEQALGKEVDARSDVFSLGVVLYELATGRPPFAGETPTETITKITRDQPPPVRTANASAPDELERIIRKCLEKEPDRRYQSARELAVDLRNLKRDSESGSTATPMNQPSQGHNRRLVLATVAALAVVAAAVLGATMLRQQRGSVESLAVLPFENGTGDPDAAYLCDGLTEGLISSLSALPDLKVISRRSSFTFRDSADDPQSIGRKLGVDALVMGRVTKSGDQLAVSAELVDVSDNSQLWGGRFNRDPGDVLTIEEDLTRTITETLKIELTNDAAEKLNRRYAVDPEAHRLYLQGRQFSIGSATEMKKAVDYFRQAIAKDPTYAEPYAALADVYTTLGYHGVLGREEALERSRDAVEQALEIDPNLAEALAASAERKYLFEWDWEGAEADLKRAVEANPGSDFVRISYAYFLSAVARFDDAIVQAKIAKELDPLSPSAFHIVAYSLMGKHEYDEAAAEFRAALDLNPNWTWGYIKLAKAYADNGQCEEALATAEDAEAELHGGGTPIARSWMGYSYGKCGDSERADAALKALDEFAQEGEVDPIAYGIIYSAFGDKDRFLDELERAVDRHSMLAAFMPGMPAYYMPELADDPRFQHLMDRTGFTHSGVHGGEAK